MTPERRYRLYYLTTLLGAFISMFPIGLHFTIGNITVYIYSYYYSKSPEENHTIEAPWLICLFISSGCVGRFTSALIGQRAGQKIAIFLGMLIYAVGIFTTYFALDVNISLMNLTLGVLTGLGNGIIFPMAIRYVVDWSEPSKLGLLTSLINAGTPLGAIFFNQLMTHYINPNNLKPNLFVGATRYFGQQEILQRVHDVFIFYGLCSLFLFIIAFSMMRTKPISYKNEKISAEVNYTKHNIKESSETTKLQERCGLDVNDTIDTVIDKSPKEMLKTKTFYSMWFSLLMADLSFSIIINYYKLFGQVWLRNDYLLTDIGTVSSFTVCIARLLGGVMVDRKGFKWTQVTYYSLSCLVFCFYYFTPRLSPWLYSMATIVGYSLTSFMHIAATTGVVQAFGKKHFAINYSIVYTAPIISHLSEPVLVQWIISNLGWFQLFYYASLSNFIGLLLIITLMENI